MGSGAGVDVSERKNLLPLPRIEPRIDRHMI